MARLLSFLLCLFFVTASLSAQKIAHVNFGNLLNDLPATETADAELEALSDQLTEKGEAMVAKFRTDYEELQQTAGDLAPVELRKRQEQLQSDQAAIQGLEQQIVVDVEKRRRELLEPIITRAKAAIEKVAKAQGYQFVVDSSVFNSVLFADEATDLTELVRQELAE